MIVRLLYDIAGTKAIKKTQQPTNTCRQFVFPNLSQAHGFSPWDEAEPKENPSGLREKIVNRMISTSMRIKPCPLFCRFAFVCVRWCGFLALPLYSLFISTVVQCISETSSSLALHLPQCLCWPCVRTFLLWKYFFSWFLTSIIILTAGGFKNSFLLKHTHHISVTDHIHTAAGECIRQPQKRKRRRKRENTLTQMEVTL